jgi:hypothetical protein
VIVEIKSTTRGIDAAKEVYDIACSRQPVVMGLANTERLHHQLQLGWTTMAYRRTKGEHRVTGVVVLAAADGAELYWLDRRYSEPAFWNQALAAAPLPASGGGGTGPRPRRLPGGGIPKWPGDAASAVLAAATGVRVAGIHNGRVAVLACGTAAVASGKPLSALPRATLDRLRAAALAASSTGRAWIVQPIAGRWRATPVSRQRPRARAAKQRSV